MRQQDFFQKLEQEAAYQARLGERRVLPERFDRLAIFVGRNTWKVLLVLSGLLAVLKTYAL